MVLYVEEATDIFALHYGSQGLVRLFWLFCFHVLDYRGQLALWVKCNFFSYSLFIDKEFLLKVQVWNDTTLGTCVKTYLWDLKSSKHDIDLPSVKSVNTVQDVE